MCLALTLHICPSVIYFHSLSPRVFIRCLVHFPQSSSDVFVFFHSVYQSSALPFLFFLRRIPICPASSLLIPLWQVFLNPPPVSLLHTYFHTICLFSDACLILLPAFPPFASSRFIFFSSCLISFFSFASFRFHFPLRQGMLSPSLVYSLPFLSMSSDYFSFILELMLWRLLLRLCVVVWFLLLLLIIFISSIITA